MNWLSINLWRGILIAVILTSIIGGVTSCVAHKTHEARIYNSQKPIVPDDFRLLKFGEPVKIGDYYYGNCGCSPWQLNEWQLVDNEHKASYNWLSRMKVKYIMRQK